MNNEPVLPTMGELSFEYVNHEGRAALRTVKVVAIRYGTSEYYPNPQWLLMAYDYDRKATREFAMNRMLRVEDLEGI